ncbi:MAG: hypothetical protein Pg6A_18350 [Termitinemataceae bacterium]|nr:MAG: hypothetical protein Pg6A_18350 [Termitinemataceae bacterium]
MCCLSCKVLKIVTARLRARTPLWDSENRPENDVPRDMYGRPLKMPAKNGQTLGSLVSVKYGLRYNRKNI